jgi:hypothetical protein
MRWAQLGKSAWYLGGTMLILSLPTFSYLIPEGVTVGSGQSDRGYRDSGWTRRSSMPSGFVSGPSAGSSFVRSPAQSILSSLAGGPRQASAGVSAAPDNVGRTSAQLIAGSGRLSQVALREDRAELLDRLGRLGRLAESQNAQDLTQLEQGYNSAISQLFEAGRGLGRYRGNPFHDAIPDDGGDNGNNGDSGNNGNGDNNGGNGNNGNGDNNGGDNPDPRPPDGGIKPPAGRKHPFVVVHSFPEAVSKERVFLSYIDEEGWFVVENKGRIGPVYGNVSVSPGLLEADERQQVYIDDSDGDGLPDLFLTTRSTQGTELQFFLGDPSGGYRLEADGFFLWKSIAGLALLDFDGDRLLELVLLFRNTPNLYVYTIADGQFKYLKEIVLPFVPSLMVDSLFDNFVRERRLHIFDDSFRRVASLTARNPRVFLIGLQGLTQAISTLRVDSEDGGLAAAEVVAFQHGGRVALAEKQGGSWVVIGSFVDGFGFQTVVWGDYLKIGSRQLFCIP